MDLTGIICCRPVPCHLCSVSDVPQQSEELTYHRITEWVRLEGTTTGHLVQPLFSRRATLEHKAQDCAQRVLECLQWERFHNLSGQCLPEQFNCTVKKFLLTFGGTCCVPVSPCCLSYCLAPPSRPWAHCLSTLLSDTCINWWGTLSVIPSWGGTSPVPSAFPLKIDAPVAWSTSYLCWSCMSGLCSLTKLQF